MSNQLVSIIMSVYNNEDTVKGSIESILSQSYKNIELIITDDCSSDRSLSIIKNYLDDKNVKFAPRTIKNIFFEFSSFFGFLGRKWGFGGLGGA